MFVHGCGVTERPDRRDSDHEPVESDLVDPAAGVCAHPHVAELQAIKRQDSGQSAQPSRRRSIYRQPVVAQCAALAVNIGL